MGGGSDVQVILSLFFDADASSWSTATSAGLPAGNCTQLMADPVKKVATNPLSFDCRLGAIPIGDSVVIAVRAAIPKSAGEVISAPGIRPTLIWAAAGWDLGAPSGSYPGQTCGQAQCTMACCPSAFGIDSILSTTAA